MIAAYEKQLQELRDRMAQMAKDHTEALALQKKMLEEAAAKAQAEALASLQAKLESQFATATAQLRVRAPAPAPVISAPPQRVQPYSQLRFG